MTKKLEGILMTMHLLIWVLSACQTEAVSYPENIVTSKPPTTANTEMSNSINFPANLLLDSQCSLPCWVGIQAGETTLEETMNILTSRYGASNISLDNANTITWDSLSIDGIHNGYVTFSGNVVSEIFLRPDEDSFYVDDLIEVLGEPTWVQVFQEPSNHCLWVSLIYSKSGVYVTLSPSDEFKGVNPLQKAFYLRIMDVSLTENWNANDSILIKWDGYKNYCQR